MGLCKCPKRRVTNLFCFVHRVNVCEDCMVANHSRCVVQSYLKWLEDSDYDAVCVLCSKSTQEGDVVRLICYDIFHQSCLDSYAQSQPQRSGYRCPKCKESLLPPANVVSPVARQLRQVLQTFSWAREGLGSQHLVVEDASENNSVFSEEIDFLSPGPTSTPRHHPPPPSPPLTSGSLHPSSPSSSSPAVHHTAVQMYDQPIARVGGLMASATGGSAADAPRVSGDTHLRDSDENKYRRKGPLELLGQWIRHQRHWSVGDSGPVMRRYLLLIFVCVVLAVTAILLLTRVGRGLAERDPSLDWKFNPNIRTGD